MKPKPPLERDIQKSILEYLKLRGFYAWRNQTQGTWDAGKGIYRNAQTLKGVSDILGVLSGGRILAIEVKRPGGKLSLDQVEFLKKVQGLGGKAFVAYSLQDVIESLTVSYPREKERIK